MISASRSATQARLSALLQPQLAKTNKSVIELLWAVWAADLRELQPELERLATHQADEFEEDRAHSYGGDARPLDGRFHFARQIVALWTEPDAGTRARMLVALAVAQAYTLLGDESPERTARLKAELKRAGPELTAEGMRGVAAMVDGLASHPPVIKGEPVPVKTCNKVAAFVHETLAF